MFNSRKFLLCLVSFSIVLLSGCNLHRVYYQTDSNVEASRSEIEMAKQHEATPEPTIVNVSGPYVDTTPVYHVYKPSWMSKHVVVRGNQLPFDFMVSRILASTQVIPHYDMGFDSMQKVSMDYEGSIEGAFNRLAAETGTHYETHKSGVDWQSLFTETFNVSFMPGGSDYLIGSKKTANKAFAGGGGSTVVTVSASTSDDEFSALQGTLSIWKDLAKTLKGLLSKDGKAFISEASTTVTVRDHAGNLKSIGEYIKQLNENLSRQVLLKVTVLNVELSKKYSYGIDWELLYKTLGKQLKFIGNFNMPIALPTKGFIDVGYEFPANASQRAAGSKLLLRALEQQGKVSTLSRPSVVTLNNQVAQINMMNQQAYLASSTTTVSGGGSNLVTTTLTPGIVNFGFTIYLLPKIQGNKIYLQVTSSLSSLVRIDTISSSPTDSMGNVTNQNSSQIQVPSLTEQHINIRSMLESGQTLVLAGFKQDRDETGKLSNLGIDLLGGKGADQKHTETVLLISPIILGGHSHPHTTTKAYH